MLLPSSFPISLQVAPAADSGSPAMVSVVPGGEDGRADGLVDETP
jgi:hypothetical protein